MKFLLGLAVGLLISFPIFTLAASNLTGKLSGRILLQTESKGEAWYVNPVDNKRYYLANGENAFDIMRGFGLGIKNKDLNKIAIGSIQKKDSSKKENLDLVLINYKIDSQADRELRNDLLSALYSNKNSVCSSIVENKTSRNHIYYIIVDNINNLKSNYNKYRDSLEFINNNLNGLDGVMQLIKNECSAINVVIN